MKLRADILVQNPDGHPIAVIEVKNRQHLSRDIAVELHSNIIANGLPHQIPYFLLLSQDTGFLWSNMGRQGLNPSPTLEFPMNDVIRRYLPKLDTKERLRDAELEFLIIQWLIDLTGGAQDDNQEPERSLALANFLDSIRGAMVVAEASLDRVR